MRGLLALVAVLVVVAPAHAAAPGIVTDLNWGISERDQDRTADAIRTAGAHWVRIGLQWRVTEPDAKGAYDAFELARLDRSIRLARGTGARVLVMAWNAPAWASGDEGRNTPQRVQDFADFMEFLARRYRGAVAAYEVWNEPDLDRFWSSGPSARAYTELLRAAYPAVKRGDPAARVVFGGLSWDFTRGGNFVERAYGYGAKGYFDVLGVHPYPSSSDPMLTRWQGWYRAARATMLAHSDAKPIFITEFGANTSTRAYDPSAGSWQAGVDERTQAELLTRMYTLLERDRYVEAAFWYGLRNNWWQADADQVEARFGLLRTDFTPKPAYEAFRLYARSAASPRRL